MAGIAPILKDLHRLRRHLKDLDLKIQQAPQQLTLQKNKLAKHEEALQQAHEAIKHLTLQNREKEGSIKTTQQLIVKYEKQLNEAVGKKEYEALKTEITQARQNISKLEDEILAAITLGEEKSTQLPEVEKTTQKARDDFAQFEKDYQERMQRFVSEKTRAEAELQTAEASLPEEVRLQYERLIAAKGMDSIAGVNGRTCMACYTEITSQMISELKRGVFMKCKNCGRMLYLET